MKALRWIPVLAALIWAAVALASEVPEPPRCVVMPADATYGPIIAPGHPGPINGSVQHITIRNSDGVLMANALVEVIFTAGTHPCGDAVHHATTNTSGQCDIALTGGGCVLGSHACIVKANGVWIRDYTRQTSPDRDGNLLVNLPDVLAFAPDYAYGATGCSDFDNSGHTDLGDLLILASAYAPQHSCP